MEDDWDLLAASFDEEPDHGLRDDRVRGAWRDLLVEALPPAPARVVDLACGTGSLSLLLADQGHDVTGVDLAPAMIEQARRKLGDRARLLLGDVQDPPLSGASFDVVLARHILFLMPDPSATLARWVRLLAPGGRLVLVEGSWSTGSGLQAEETRRLVLGHRDEAVVTPLSDRAALWGRPVDDERYLVVSRR